MDLKEKINSFPKTPGIYMMKDKDENIIYVGKSKKLQERVKSYFVNSNSHSRKNKRMINSIDNIEIIQTDTELDALILECKLIKEIKPMYNKLMKNHERYSYIKIDYNSDYPKLHICSDIEDEGTYFGPYSINKRLEEIKEILNDYYKLRTCINMNKCFRYDMNKCIGPCRDNKSKGNYLLSINKLIKDLNLKGSSEASIIVDLKNQLQKEIELLNFEKAAKLNENIKLIELLTKKQDIINNIDDEIILAWIELGNNAYKIYTINKYLILKTEIMSKEYFDNLNKDKYVESILENLDKDKKVVKDDIVNKYNIDFINIIYSYIKYNKDIKHEVIKI